MRRCCSRRFLTAGRRRHGDLQGSPHLTSGRAAEHHQDASRPCTRTQPGAARPSHVCPFGKSRRCRAAAAPCARPDQGSHAAMLPHPFAASSRTVGVDAEPRSSFSSTDGCTGKSNVRPRMGGRRGGAASRRQAPATMRTPHPPLPGAGARAPLPPLPGAELSASPPRPPPLGPELSAALSADAWGRAPAPPCQRPAGDAHPDGREGEDMWLDM